MNNLQQMLTTASQQLHANNPAQAIKLCKIILKKSPGHVDAVYLLAKALAISSKTDVAIQQLKKGLRIHKNNTLLLSTLGEFYLKQGKHAEAEEVLKKALSHSPNHLISLIVMGKVLVLLERYAEAEVLLRRALTVQQSQNQDHLLIYSTLSEALMPGESYRNRLAQFHQWIKPACYLEIGVETGATLRLALAETVAIGIDPNPIINVTLPEKSRVFALESDTFFSQHKLPDVAGHDTIDFAFIDGLHVFEQALRDFINVEKNARKESVIVIHDCLPLDNPSSQPDRITHFWSGDPWKVMAVLREFRPDLCCFTIPTAPTGLGVVTHLDPNNTVLYDNFDEIITTYQNKDYDWLVKQGLTETLGVFVNDWKQITDRITTAHG